MAPLFMRVTEKKIESWGEQRKASRLIRVLKHKNNDIRHAAVEALGNIGDPRATEPLIKVLNAGGPVSLRRAEAEALGKIGDKRATIPLIQHLSIEGMGRQVIAALGKIDDARSIEPLVRMFGDREESAAAAVALASMKSHQEEFLIKALDNPNHKVQAAAAYVLEEWGWQPHGDSEVLRYSILRGDAKKCVEFGEAAVQALAAEMSSTDIDGKYYEDFANALAEIGGLRAAEALVRLTENSEQHPPVPLATLYLWRALQKIGRPALEPLLKAAKHRSAKVRAEAIGLIGSIAAKDSADAILEALEDPEAEVRRKAIRALRDVPDSRVLNALIPRLADETLGREAAYTLIEHGPSAVEPLLDALETAVRNKDAETARNAAYALGGLGDRRAIQPLLRIFMANSLDLQATAAFSLGRLDATEAAEPLFQVAKSTRSGDLWRTCITALCEIGDPRGVEALLEGLENSSFGPPVREHFGFFVNALIYHGGARIIDPFIYWLGKIMLSRKDEWTGETFCVRDYGSRMIGALMRLHDAGSLSETEKNRISTMNRKWEDYLRYG